MKIAHTRAMISAALAGALDEVAYETDPIFNLAVPQTCPGVPADVLRPRTTWRDPAAYDEQARKLARMFADNFRAFETDAAPDVKAAGPRS
jgi:phosphoenolpyruvate carboxykinase (ATP)